MARKRKISLTRLKEEEILDLRFCDLDLSLEAPMVKACTTKLLEELHAKKIRSEPFFYYSTEWFTPDGVPGIAIPFYLADPKLHQLEKKMLYFAEGGTPTSCMKILRHEMGHVIDNAYRLRRRRDRQKVFGRSSTPYPDAYNPMPYSRKYVVHLDSWYAQAHPDEDWAETFAVWLSPRSGWRKKYKNWPTALKKLNYVDSVMHEISEKAPPVRIRERVEDIRNSRKTLRSHYSSKQSHYGVDSPEFFEKDLTKVFTTKEAACGKPIRASRFLRKEKALIRQMVSKWTGQYQYVVHQVIDEVIDACDEQDLYLQYPPEETRLHIVAMMTAQTLHYLSNGLHQISL